MTNLKESGIVPCVMVCAALMLTFTLETGDGREHSWKRTLVSTGREETIREMLSCKCKTNQIVD